MGQALEPAAVAECVRATLEQFLADHPDLEQCEVEVALNTETDGGFGLTVDGFVFEIAVAQPRPTPHEMDTARRAEQALEALLEGRDELSASEALKHLREVHRIEVSRLWFRDAALRLGRGIIRRSETDTVFLAHEPMAPRDLAEASS